MSTIFNVPPGHLATYGLNQTLSYTEADSTMALEPITFITSNYAGAVTLTLVFTGEGLDLFQLKTNDVSVEDLITQPSLGTWVITSERHNDVAACISDLYLEFINDDVYENWTVTSSFGDGAELKNGTISIDGTTVVDAININQDVDYNEDAYGWVFTNYPEIQDQAGPNSGKTYRVTFAPRTGGDEQYKIMFKDANGDQISYSSTAVLSGTQDEVNALLRSDGLSEFHFDFGPEWNDEIIIDYTQEVITGAEGAPYIQETGVFNFSGTAEDEYEIYEYSQRYEAGVPVEFIPVTITDTRHVGDPALIYYTSFVLDPSVGSLTYGTFNGTDTYSFSGTYDETVTELANFSFTSILSSNESQDIALSYSQSRQQQKGDPTWSNSNVSVHAEDQLIKFTSTWYYAVKYTNIYTDERAMPCAIGQIIEDSDPATQYTVTLTLSDPLAGSLSQSTFVGTKAEVNAALQATMFTGEAGFYDDFTITYAQTNETDGIFQGELDTQMTWKYGPTRVELDALISGNNDYVNITTYFITDFSYMFLDYNRTIQDITDWDVSNGVTFESMFDGVFDFNQDISSWDVSSGTNFSRMFWTSSPVDGSSFNQNLSSWDVSSGTNFSYMFNNARGFNNGGVALTWDISSGINFSYMFRDAIAFNQDLSSWDVSSGTNFNYMFNDTNAFNQDLSSWDVSSGTNFSGMFNRAVAFDNGGVALTWDVSSGTDFNRMFTYAFAFNQDLSSWDVSSGTDFNYMFNDARAFNQDLSSWDVSSVTDFSYMFSRTDAFDNGGVALTWDVSSGTNLNNMFSYADAFNQDLSSWDVSSVLYFYNMFRETTSFNQDISSWVVSSGIDFSQMFDAAAVFNQDISGWDTTSATEWSDFKINCPLTDPNTPPLFLT